jgi:hypothetical protein
MKIAVVLNESIKPRERREEGEKLPSQLSTHERLPGSCVQARSQAPREIRSLQYSSIARTRGGIIIRAKLSRQENCKGNIELIVPVILKAV